MSMENIDLGFVDGEKDEDLMKGKLLIFSICGDSYGIEITYVIEIISIQFYHITHVPYLPYYMKGVTNLRGQIVPIMDVGMRFGREPQPYTDRTCIVVLDVDGISVGLIVDEVEEVLTIEQDEIVPPPRDRPGSLNQYVRGICQKESGIKLLLDDKRLLYGQDTEGFETAV